MNYTPLKTTINVKGLVSAFRYTFQQDFRYSGERHNSWEFVFVEKGKIIASADENRYIIKSGELICHKPMEFHNLNPYQSGTTVIILCFHCDDVRMQYFENKIFSVDQRQRAYLYDLADRAESFFLFKDPLDIARDGFMEKDPHAAVEDSQFLKNIIELLILSLFSSKSTEIPLRASRYANLLRRSALTKNIKKYLQENLGAKISIEEISRKASYSPSTVKTAFKNETGKSIMEYYNDLRLDAAKKMLGEKTASVAQIAEVLGFSDAPHFINFFKKRTGSTPKKYSAG